MFNFFVFDKFTELETERLRLRQLLPTDAAAVLAILRVPDVADPVGATPLTTIQQARFAIERYDQVYAERRGIRWGVTRRDDATLIGMVSYQKINVHSRYAELAYMVGQDHWRQGYATEALRATLRYGFQTMNLHRAEAMTEPSNTASRGLLEKLGFQHEGTLRGRFLAGGRFRDDAVYGLLRSEWEAAS